MSSLRFKSYAPSAHTQRELIALPLHKDSSVVGSFAHDQLNGYDYCWKSIEEAEAWRIQEEKSKTIELRHKETRISPPVSSDLWSEKWYYVCSRGHSGGKSQYVKKTQSRSQISLRTHRMQVPPNLEALPPCRGGSWAIYQRAQPRHQKQQRTLYLASNRNTRRN